MTHRLRFQPQLNHAFTPLDQPLQPTTGDQIKKTVPVTAHRISLQSYAYA